MYAALAVTSGIMFKKMFGFTMLTLSTSDSSDVLEKGITGNETQLDLTPSVKR